MQIRGWVFKVEAHHIRMQIYGNFQGFPYNNACVWVGIVMTPVLDSFDLPLDVMAKHETHTHQSPETGCKWHSF